MYIETINARFIHDAEADSKALLRMEGLMVAAKQQLTCNNDYLSDLITDTTGCELCRKEMGAHWADQHPISPWIAIEDRLPDKEDIYFTRCYDKAEDNEYFEVDWNQSDMRFMNPHTTHWMPIPEL